MVWNINIRTNDPGMDEFYNMYFQEPIKHEIDKPLLREIEFSAF